MYFRVILSTAGLAIAFSLAPGQAEVLAVDSAYAINGVATIGDPPIVSGGVGVASEASSGDFEVQSAPIVSRDTFESRSRNARCHGRSLNFQPGRQPFSALRASVDNVLLQ